MNTFSSDWSAVTFCANRSSRPAVTLQAYIASQALKPLKAMLDLQLQAHYRLVKATSLLGAQNWWTKLTNFLLRSLKGRNPKGLDCREQYIPSSTGGPAIRVRIFRPLHSTGKLPGL